MNITVLNNSSNNTDLLYNRTNFTLTTSKTILNTTVLRNTPSSRTSIFSTRSSQNSKTKTSTTTKSLLALLQLSFSTTKLFNNSTTVKTGFRNSLVNACSCDRVVPIPNKLYQDENIWKFAFFALAFIVGLISIMLILTFSTKILLNRFQKKSEFNQKKGNVSKKTRKVSSISLLDFDAELASNYAPSIQNRKRRSLSSPSSTGSTRTKNLIKQENSSDSTIYSSQNIFNDLIKNQSESVSRQQSYIYGVTNKAFENETEKDIKCERIVSFRKPSIPSSFKPFHSDKKIQSASFKFSQTDVNTEKHDKPEPDTYMQPWKLPSVADEYEALEINPIIESAALSPATTFSECFSEKQNEGNFSGFPSNKIKDFGLMCMNNNELISKSSKITQELEKKLKERRQMMESKSDKFHHRLLDENDLEEISPTISLSALEKRIQNWQNELNTKISKKNSMTSNASCVCPCHSHSHSCNSKNSFRNCEKHLERKESKEKDVLHKTSNQNRQITKAKDKSFESNGKSKKPKIVIDNASSLPTKRESIRALMETKTVTQNKQKEVLEMHLNTLISSRRTTCKISESSQ